MTLVEEVVETTEKVEAMLDYLFLGRPSPRALEALRTIRQEALEAATNTGLGAVREAVKQRLELGGVHRLPRHIPLKIATGMMLTGRHITAAEAHRWGLVNEVVPLKDLLATAERWAAEIMECSPLSVQATKEQAYQGLHR